MENKTTIKMMMTANDGHNHRKHNNDNEDNDNCR